MIQEGDLMNVLYIGAHNDDCECNAGGVAALLKEKGCKQLFVNPASIWHGDNISEETRKEWELQEIEAAKILGAQKIQTADRYSGLYQCNADDIKKLTKIICDFNPDIVFIHWPMDNHIEHRAVAELSEKALCLAHVKGSKISEIYAFEAGTAQTSDFFKPDFYIDVESVLETVNESLRCFNQNTAKAHNLCRDKETRSIFRGSQIGIKYAEAFKIIKYPNRNNDFMLKQLLNDQFCWAGNGMYPAGGYNYF